MTTTHNARESRFAFLGPKGVRYTIIHQGSDGKEKGKVVFNFFDKDKLQAVFDQFVSESKAGDTVEYFKEDRKAIYPAMLYVENLDGKAYVYDGKGRKKIYKNLKQ